MGNCCTAEDRDDPNYNMRQGMKAGGAGGTDAPSEAVAQKVAKMNPYNAKVAETDKKLKAFNAPGDSKYDQLPELGPYKYNNGATYVGQFLNGQRTGFGKQVW